MSSFRTLSGRYIVSALIALAIYGALSHFDALEWWYAFTRRHDAWQLDEIPLVFIIVSGWFAWIFHQEYRFGQTTLERLKREAAERAEAEARAVEAMRARERFFAAASHDLRTPLNTILGFSEIIRDELMGPTGAASYRDYAAAINVSGGVLLRTVNQIIDISRMSDAQVPLDETEFEIEPVFREVEQACLFSIRKKRMRLSLFLSDPSARISFDRLRFGQMIQNLIANAIKYSLDDSTVTVKSERLGDRLAITIEDQGIGMSREEKERLMEPFQRSDDPRVAAIEGAGLGLAIVRSIAERHGCDLRIESAKDAGTRITVTLPANRTVIPACP